MIRTLIFDWDGTLHDTTRLYGCAFRKAYDWLVAQGAAPARHYADADVTRYLGMNAKDMWNTFMPLLPQEMKTRASDIIGREMISRIDAGEAILYPGAEETLTRLKEMGFEMTILSNCKRPYLRAHRSAFGLDRWFTGYYCCEDFGFVPKEEIFPRFRDRHPESYVMIGDRASDLKVASVHGLPSVGCAYGFGSPEELGSATCVANDVTELPELIEKLLQENRE
ncbi:MAG: HAD family hydrolase [Clostridia bacterium]|nr:HAD family hydrolase [Clostridia bacterium]